MAQLTRKGQDAPAVPTLALDLPLFKDGRLVGVGRRARWLCWPQTAERATRVLIVDDVKDTARVISGLLKKQGFQTACAFDGVSGLAAARALLPDLLLLNVGMPGLNGFEVLGALRCDPGTQDIKVIVTSGAPRMEARARTLGAQDFLALPFGVADLLGKVDRALKL